MLGNIISTCFNIYAAFFASLCFLKVGEKAAFLIILAMINVFFAALSINKIAEEFKK